jgi:hypothetical protein
MRSKLLAKTLPTTVENADSEAVHDESMGRKDSDVEASNPSCPHPVPHSTVEITADADDGVEE